MKQGFTLSIKNIFNQYSPSIRLSKIIKTLHMYLVYEHTRLADKELDFVDEKVQPLISALQAKIKTTHPDMHKFYEAELQTVYQIMRHIREVKYNRLSNELLESVNFEINQDTEDLQNNFNSLGFNKNLGKSLDYIEQQFMESSDNFDYKTCADHLRSFSSGFIKEIALKVSQVNGDTLRPKKPHKYLKDQRFFNGLKEAEFLQAFQNYLSSSSVHKLNSEREVVRTAKNIAIEFALLLIQRLEEYIAHQTSDPK